MDLETHFWVWTVETEQDIQILQNSISTATAQFYKSQTIILKWTTTKWVGFIFKNIAKFSKKKVKSLPIPMEFNEN